MYMIMISVISLLDGFYVFDEESYKLTGEHTGRIFTLGQMQKPENLKNLNLRMENIR